MHAFRYRVPQLADAVRSIHCVAALSHARVGLKTGSVGMFGVCVPVVQLVGTRCWVRGDATAYGPGIGPFRSVMSPPAVMLPQRISHRSTRT